MAPGMPTGRRGLQGTGSNEDRARECAGGWGLGLPRGGGAGVQLPIRPQGGCLAQRRAPGGGRAPRPFLTAPASRRAEPALTRVREDRRRIVLPAIDNIKYDTFEVQQYASAAHGYNWGLWCMYIIPPQDWLDRGDEAAPIR